MVVLTKENLLKAAMPLLAEKETAMRPLFLKVERNLSVNGFIPVRRNVDIKNPKFKRDEYRVAYYTITFLFSDQYGTGRYMSTTCTKTQTKARQRLFALINADTFTIELAEKWLKSALVKAEAARTARAAK